MGGRSDKGWSRQSRGDNEQQRCEVPEQRLSADRGRTRGRKGGGSECKSPEQITQLVNSSQVFASAAGHGVDWSDQRSFSCWSIGGGNGNSDPDSKCKDHGADIQVERAGAAADIQGFDRGGHQLYSAGSHQPAQW